MSILHRNRMNTLSGIPSSTIHLLLKYSTLLFCLASLYYIFYFLHPIIHDLKSETSRLKKEIEWIKEDCRQKGVVGSSSDQSFGGDGAGGGSSCQPTLEYEQIRRRVTRDSLELYRFVKSEISTLKFELKKGGSGGGNDISQLALRQLYLDVRERYMVISASLKRLKLIDGYESWRKSQSLHLTEVVRNEFHSLQNPPKDECMNVKDIGRSVRYLGCSLNKACGYGCQVHHAAYCFITAYSLSRQLILKSNRWRYNKSGFEEIFLPVSSTCNITNIKGGVAWNSLKSRQSSAQIIMLPIVDIVSPKPKAIPPAIPSHLAIQIEKIHEEPIVWWVGQVMGYLLRYQPHIKTELEHVLSKIGGGGDSKTSPLVGVHVRRTDKVGSEAKFHSIDEYMQHIVDYFDEMDIYNTLFRNDTSSKHGERRVYVATDDPNVLSDFRSKFTTYESKSYKFYGDISISKSASLNTRYTKSSLMGILKDIFILSKCSLIVATFSSQVGRLGYELMQYNNPEVDMSQNYRSLDDIWYFGGQNEHQQTTILRNEVADNQLNFDIGDVIGVAGNHWNGFNMGKHLKAKISNLYPLYKTVEKIPTFDKLQVF